ncbi:MAG: beta-galactosidase, partial [Opitutaceae bacterium]|nr:beta-galactosidase [Opitutaceae bacterium]
MARAMGLNTVSAYLFWNVHEPQPGEFTFTGQADVAEYVRLAAAEGLKVILRPGPYACAEWDFGGLPSWLLATPDIRVRCMDERFTAAARRYLLAIGKELAKLQISRGGPILLVQVENEMQAKTVTTRPIWPSCATPWSRPASTCRSSPATALARSAAVPWRRPSRWRIFRKVPRKTSRSCARSAPTRRLPVENFTPAGSTTGASATPP